MSLKERINYTLDFLIRGDHNFYTYNIKKKKTHMVVCHTFCYYAYSPFSDFNKTITSSCLQRVFSMIKCVLLQAILIL